MDNDACVDRFCRHTNNSTCASNRCHKRENKKLNDLLKIYRKTQRQQKDEIEQLRKENRQLVARLMSRCKMWKSVI